MFDFTINNGAFFKDSFSSLSTVIYEGRIEFNEKGIYCRGCDESKIYFFEFGMGRRYIEGKIDVNCSVGLNLVDLGKICKRINKESKIDITYDDKKSQLVIRELKTNDTVSTFRINEIDVGEFEDDESIKNLANVQYPLVFHVGSKELLDELGKCEIYSEAFSIGCEKGKIMISASGNGSYEGELNASILNLKNGVKCIYSTKFAKQLLEQMEAEITILMRKDRPLFCSNGNLSELFYRFFLAPRVEKPEED